MRSHGSQQYVLTSFFGTTGLRDGRRRKRAQKKAKAARQKASKAAAEDEARTHEVSRPPTMLDGRLLHMLP